MVGGKFGKVVLAAHACGGARGFKNGRHRQFGRATQQKLEVLKGVGRNGGDFLPARDRFGTFPEGAGIVLVGKIARELLREESERYFFKVVIGMRDELVDGNLQRIKHFFGDYFELADVKGGAGLPKRNNESRFFASGKRRTCRS